MKRLLIIPVVLSLIVFSLYPEDVDGMDTQKKGKVTQEIQLEEAILDIYNNSKNEINISVEENETTEEEFSVEIKGDLNTTKETVITLSAVVKNAEKLEACNYFWYEGKELIDLGATLEKAFDKGEHNITLVVKDVNGTETNTSVMVRAYNYHSIKKLNYDPHYGHLLYVERVITNHKGQYVLYDNGTYSREIMTYDDNDQLIESMLEYYFDSEENRRTEFTYDNKGNRLASQTFNMEGDSLNYMLNVYDENSTVINVKYGRSPDDIDDTEVVYGSIIYEEVPYDSTVYEEVKIPEDIVELNDNGQTVYEKYHYGDAKLVNKITYDEENKLIKSERSFNSSYEQSSTTTEYDVKGNPLSVEKKYAMEGHTSCHYSSNNTFTDLGQIKSKVSVLLGGECHYLDEVKRIYTYDEKGNVENIKSLTDGVAESEAYTTLEIIKEYTNELDI